MYIVTPNLFPDLQLPLYLSTCVYYKHIKFFMLQTTFYPNLCPPYLTNTDKYLSSLTFLNFSTQVHRPEAKETSWTLFLFPSFCFPAEFSNLPSGINSLFKFFQTQILLTLTVTVPVQNPVFFHLNCYKKSIIGPSAFVFSHFNIFSTQPQSLK